MKIIKKIIAYIKSLFSTSSSSNGGMAATRNSNGATVAN